MADLPDPLAGLNPEQRRAAEAVRGPVRILAGAGTGKTRTITHRIAHQVVTGVAAPEQVLAVTFTDRAAAELRGRLAALGLPRPVRAATFHAAAWAQLRHFWPRISDLPLPEILESKVRELIGAARRSGADAADLAGEIEWAQARRLTPDGYVAATQAGTPGAREGSDPRGGGLAPTQFAEIWQAYEDAKERSGRLDYGDMLLWCDRMLREHADIAAEVRDRYRFVTVDEFQDVNPAQNALLEAWLGGSDEICVVGDDDQTIYSFTGADAGFLIGFSDRYPAATSVTLSTSYRSTPQVLDLANRMLWPKPAGTRKHLRATRGDGPPPAFVEHADGDAEIASTVRWVRALLDAGTPPGQIAIAFRVNAQSEAFETALSDAGIGVVVRGTTSFFARREIRQAVRALSAAVAVDPSGEAALRRGGPERLDDHTSRPAPPAPAKVATAVLRDALSHDRRQEPTGRAARDRWRNLEVLLDLVDRLGSTDDLEGVVGELTRRAEGRTDGDEGAVVLLTLHKAKGLEFEAVALVALEEGLMPISHAKTDEEVAEERRLLYVGVTRAKSVLRLSWARSREGRGGRASARRPSRFLYGLGPGAPVSGRTQNDGGRRGSAKAGASARVCACGSLLLGSAERRRRRCDRCAGSTAAATESLDAAGTALADRLREWRRNEARSRAKPAYTIFSDRTLVALASARPRTIEDLLAVPGIGPAKAGDFGEVLLEVIGQAHNQLGMPPG